MKLYMSPENAERYRAVKQIPVSSQRSCKGECKKRRSLTQFEGGDDICITCRRRMPTNPVST